MTEVNKNETKSDLFSEGVISRFKESLKLANDSKMAEFIGVPRQTVFRWKKENSVDLRKLLGYLPPENVAYVFTGVKPADTSLEARIKALEDKLK